MGDGLVRAVIAVRGDVKTAATLSRWAARAGNSAPAMSAIASYIEERERELFATEGASAGRPWAPDNAITLESKERAGLGDKTLQSSLALLNSLTDSSDPNAIREIGPGILRFGTKLPYAAELARAHTTKGGDPVPARRPIDLTARDRYAIVKLMSGWITGNTNTPLRPSIRTFRGPFL